MAEPFMGEIQIYAFAFAPKGWAFCNGQLLPINQNQALFSLLGTTYGGNGVSNFALPDLRSRSATHFGQGNGLSNYVQGETVGFESVVLLNTQMPTHTHLLGVVSGNNNTIMPNNNFFCAAPSGVGDVYGGTADTGGSGVAVPIDGSNQPHDNRQPYLTLNFCIALQGIFPPRN